MLNGCFCTRFKKSLIIALNVQVSDTTGDAMKNHSSSQNGCSVACICILHYPQNPTHLIHPGSDRKPRNQRGFCLFLFA